MFFVQNITDKISPLPRLIPPKNGFFHPTAPSRQSCQYRIYNRLCQHNRYRITQQPPGGRRSLPV